MIIQHGKGTTEYGPGVAIELDGNDVAIAIHAYLIAHGIYVDGPRTITVNGELCKAGHIYVDPSGFVIYDGEKITGRGPAKPGVVTFNKTVLTNTVRETIND